MITPVAMIRERTVLTLPRPTLCRLTFLFLLLATIAGCGADKKVALRERADRFFKAGEYEKAKIEYANLLQLDHDNERAIQQLGVIWLEEGAPLRAYPFLLKARELAPDDIAIRTKLARVLASLGDVAAAKEEASAVLQRAPGEEEALLLLADSIRSEKDVAEVEKQLRKIPEGNDLAYHMAWAALSARKGDLAYAESELEAALKLAPREPRVHLAMASVQMLRQDRKRAGEEFRIAAELSPARSTARLKYAEFERQTGKSDEAIRILKEVTKQAPDYLPAWSLLAETMLAQKKFAEALAMITEVLARDPGNLEASVLQTEAWLGQGETKKAVAALEPLASTYPKGWLISYQLARAYLADNNPSRAATALDNAIVAKPDYAEAILLRAELSLRSGEASRVIPVMKTLLKQRPGLVPAQRLLAEAYRISGQPEDAIGIIREEIRANPQSPDAYLRLGLILREQKKWDDAKETFERALALAPGNFQAVEQLVELDILRQDFAGAMKLLGPRLAKNPDSPRELLISAKIDAAQGKWDRAETTLRKTLELDPNVPGAFSLLIATYLATNRADQAVNELQAFLKKHPDDKPALTSLAMIATKVKDYPKARDTYEKLLSIEPAAVEPMNNLAYLYAEFLNQPDKASELARKARALRPNDPLIADTLGWSLYKKGQYREAQTFLQESASKLPANHEIQFHLGMASYMMADSNAAQEAFRKALGAGSDFPGKAEAQRRLAFLENDAKQTLPLDQLQALVKSHPGDVLAWMRLGAAQENRGDYAKAAVAYEEAFKINSQILPVVIQLAQLYGGPLRKAEPALDFAKRARNLAPNDAQVAGILGAIAYQLGNFTWAYNLLQESARQLTSDPKVLRDFAWAAYSLGKVSEARQTMQRLLKNSPKGEGASDANTFLALTAPGLDPARLAAAEPQIEKTLAADAAYVPALMAKGALLEQRGESDPAIAIYGQVLQRYPDFGPARERMTQLSAQKSKGD